MAIKRKREDYHLWHPFTNMQTLFSLSVVFVEGNGIRLKDEDGNEYINAVSSLWNVHCGFGREEIISAICTQLRKLAFSSIARVANLPAIELANKLAEISPHGLNRVFLTNTGSEAVEGAIKMVRHCAKAQATKKYQMVSLERSYHGVSYGALSASGIAEMKEAYEPMLPGFHHIPAPYCYRCSFGKRYPGCDIECATNLGRTIEEHGADNIGAFIVEPVMAFAGGIVPPDEYFTRVMEICREFDVLLILDEITTGFGRLGTMFAADYWNIEADIMTVSKGINSGYLPLGATLAQDAIYETITGKAGDTWVWADQGIFAHGSTTDGHPASCAAALANITVIEEEGLVENARLVGAHLLEKLKRLLEYSFVGDVRGLGLLIAIEFVTDKDTREPLPADQLFQISTRLFRSGLFVYSMGNTISLLPPLILDRATADEIYAIVNKTLSRTQRMMQ